jgi:hypothetical protein
MPEFCTCGAQLPPDALFCHKCGKPQRELVAPEVHIPEHAEFVPPPAPLPLAPDALPMSFRNPVAMRIALHRGHPGGPVELGARPQRDSVVGAGYFAVFFYRRRTDAPPEPRRRAPHGLDHGRMMFAIVAVLFTGFVIVFNVSGGIEVLQSSVPECLRSQGPGRCSRRSRAARDRIFLMQLFLFITCLSMIGGALGAKLAGRASRPPGGGNIV